MHTQTESAKKDDIVISKSFSVFWNQAEPCMYDLYIPLFHVNFDT